MVCLVCTSGKVPAADLLVDALREGVPGLASVMVNINREDTNVILGGNEFVLWGKDYITDVLCGLRFRLSPALSIRSTAGRPSGCTSSPPGKPR